MTYWWSRRPLAWLVALCLLLFLPRFFSLPVIDRDEGRFAQATKQMVESGDYLDIRYRDIARYKKPIGAYWLQSASVSIFGGAEAPIWAYRIPSLLAAIAAVLLTFLTIRTLIDPRTGFVGAVLLALTLVLAGEARIAKTDAIQLALITAMLWVVGALFAARQLAAPKAESAARRDARLPWVFWLSLGGGILVKGPIAPLVVGLGIATLVAVERDTRWLWPLAHPLAIAAGCAIFLPWLTYIILKSEGEFLAASVGEDLFAKVASGQEGHGAPPGTHLVLLLLTFWPASALLVARLGDLPQACTRSWARFALAWALPTWLVFELVPTKLLHYLLPVFPAIAMLTAGLWLQPARPTRAVFRIAAALVLMFGPALLGALIGFMVLDASAVPLPGLVAFVVAETFALAAAWSIWRDTRSTVVWQLVPLALATYAGLFSVAAQYPRLWPSNQLIANLEAAQARAEVCRAPLLLNVGYDEPSLVWLSRGDTRRAEAEEAARVLRDEPCAVAVIEKRSRDRFVKELNRLGIATRLIAAPVEGFAIGAGKTVMVEMHVRQGVSANTATLSYTP